MAPMTAAFTADMRTCLAPLLGLDPGAMTSGQLSYDLRRLRIHGLIERSPRTFRYQVTPGGIRQALFLTRLTQQFLIPAWPSWPTPARQLPPTADRRQRLPRRYRRPRPPGQAHRLTYPYYQQKRPAIAELDSQITRSPDQAL
jgi:hypothetical protein